MRRGKYQVQTFKQREASQVTTQKSRALDSRYELQPCRVLSRLTQPAENRRIVPAACSSSKVNWTGLGGFLLEHL